MRRLWIMTLRGVILDGHAPVRKRYGERLARRPLPCCGSGNTGKDFFDCCLGFQGKTLQKNGLLITIRRLTTIRRLIRFSAYLLEPAGKRREKLAARGQECIKRKREYAKEHAQEQAGKRSQKENKERLAHAAVLERIEGVKGRKERVGATERQRTEFDE